MKLIVKGFRKKNTFQFDHDSNKIAFYDLELLF